MSKRPASSARSWRPNYFPGSICRSPAAQRLSCLITARVCLSDAVCQALIRRGHELSIPTLVDPKGLDYQKYSRCDVISPNRLELAAATSGDYGNLELLLQKGQQLRSKLEIGRLMVTLGELGITMLDSTGVHRFPALAREVFERLRRR